MKTIVYFWLWFCMFAFFACETLVPNAFVGLMGSAMLSGLIMAMGYAYKTRKES